MATHLSKSVNNLRNPLNSALINIKECWFGNMSREMQTYIQSSLNEGISLETLEDQLRDLEEILILKESIKKELDAYAYTAYQLEQLSNNPSDTLNKSIFVNTLNNCNTNINAILSFINAKNTEVSNLYKNAIKYDTSKHTEKHDIYGLSLGKLLQASKYLDDTINGLTEIKTSLNTSNYSSMTLKAMYRMKIYKSVVVQAGVARNAILNTINWLTIQIKLIQTKIDNHIDNIMKYENNQTVTLGNTFGNSVSVSMSDSENETKTETVEETYTMKKGDTLIAVAAMYPGVTWQQIAKANNITDTRNIDVGQKLIIPGQTKTVTVASESSSESNSSSSSTAKVQTITSAPISGLETLTTDAIGAPSNWASSAGVMSVGVYGAFTEVNAEGKMIDQGKALIRNGGYDFKEITNDGKIHRGVDLDGGDNDYGTPIKSMGPGIVIRADETESLANVRSDATNDGCGSTVWVLHETVDENNNFGYQVIKYEHFAKGSINVNEGDVVDETTTLGKMGATGKTSKGVNGSSGVHVHIEVSEIPESVLNPKELAGKTTEEVLQIAQAKNIDSTYDYGEDYWIDPMDSFEEQGLI